VTSRLASIVLVWPLAATAFAQSPRDRVQARPADTGRIAGAVVSIAAESKPLRRARVTINGSSLQPGRTAITADDGTFAFDALPAGQYTIAVVKSGYITTAYGASGPGRPGLPVTIGPGEQRRITVGVPKGSAITGMLTDPDGQPLPGLQVRALTYRITPPGGERRLVPAQTTNVMTDDRGIYRIFGLPAGEYAVVVRPRPGAEANMTGLRPIAVTEVRQALAEVRQARDRRTTTFTPPRSLPPPEPARAVALAPVFYPGTTNAAHARLVALGIGEERSSVDIHVDYVPVARVAGTVVTSTGGGTRASVRLLPDSQETLIEDSFRGTSTDAEGAFAFDHVPPGRYVVAVRASPDGSTQLRYDPTTSLWASTEIAVNGEDIANVVLTPVAGLTIEGRLVFEGQRSARLTEFRGMALPLSSRLSPGAQPFAEVAPDGRFSIRNVPAGLYQPEFTAGIRTPIGAWWLKSVVMEGREALDAPLEFRTSTNDAMVTFADIASELNGRVTDAVGQPAPNCVVVVFPVNNTSWFFNSRRIAAVPPDAQGRYVIRNLPAGDYLIVARRDLNQLEWFNPETLQQLVPTAARLKIGDNEQLTHDVRVTSR
jgi:uncharacterized protein (DUF2141 family)